MELNIIVILKSARGVTAMILRAVNRAYLADSVIMMIGAAIQMSILLPFLQILIVANSAMEII